MQGHRDIYGLFEYGFDNKHGHRVKPNHRKAFRYLLDLEREGYVDHWLFRKIGYCYSDYFSPTTNDQTSLRYYNKALSLGYVPVYSECHGRISIFVLSKDDVALTLLEAERKGLRDERNLIELIDCLCSRYYYNPSDKVLGNFKDRYKMALYYCDVLIDRGSPKGYLQKGRIYSGYYTNKLRDVQKAISVWEEADRAGLAEVTAYSDAKTGLVYVYMYVCLLVFWPSHGSCISYTYSYVYIHI